MRYPAGSEEQKQLLGLVESELMLLWCLSLQTAATRPPPPTKEELELKAEAKARGERQLMEAVRVFGNKVTRRASARREAARGGARGLPFCGQQRGARDAIMGNLYAVINAEEERNGAPRSWCA